MPSEKYLSTAHLMCFLFRQKKRYSVIYLRCKNVKKVDRIQTKDKCKERDNTALHLTETKFVTSRGTSGRTPYTFNKKNKSMKHLNWKSIHNFYPQIFSVLNDKTPTMLSIYSRNKPWLKVIFWCFLTFSVLLARSSEDAWLDMGILFYFLAIHDMDFTKLCSCRA